MPKMLTWGESDFNKAYDRYTLHLQLTCAFAREMIGGLPGHPDDLERYIEHHMEIHDPDERKKVMARLLQTELGLPTQINSGETDEITEVGVTQANVVRKDERGRPWLGDWMIKASFKMVAQGMDLWRVKIGVKKDMSEFGRVNAIGRSLLEPDHPERIYLRDASGKEDAPLGWTEVRGRVDTPKGPKSIITAAEKVLAGATFEFEYKLPSDKLSEIDVLKIVSFFRNNGLGSMRGRENGKVVVVKAEAVFPDENLRVAKPEKTEKGEAKKAKSKPGDKDKEQAA